jgi:hypothetical protein
LIKKIVLTTFLFSFSAFAQEVAIAKASVENLLESYGEYLTEFLLKNTEYAVPLEKGSEPLYVIYPSLSWEGKAYNLCIKVYKANNFYSSSCVTVSFAEDIYQRLKTLKNSEFFNLKEIPQNTIIIKVKINANPQYDKIKLVSQRGDSLTRYVSVAKEGNGVNVGSGFVNLNTIVLDEDASAKVFKLLIENNKIEKVIVE